VTKANAMTEGATNVKSVTQREFRCIPDINRKSARYGLAAFGAGTSRILRHIASPRPDANVRRRTRAWKFVVVFTCRWSRNPHGDDLALISALPSGCKVLRLDLPEFRVYRRWSGFQLATLQESTGGRHLALNWRCSSAPPCSAEALRAALSPFGAARIEHCPQHVS
jgi:hypothetical protein